MSEAIARALAEAAADSDPVRTEALLVDLDASVRRGAAPSDAATKAMLSALRNEMWFDLVRRLSETLYRTGATSPFVRRQLAQTFIEEGDLAAALALLTGVLNDTGQRDRENSEALGLIGRAYKQSYVDRRGEAATPGGEAAITAAIEAYRAGFERRLSEDQTVWHGINLAACLYRAEMDGYARVAPAGAWRDVARSVLASIEGREDGGLTTWDLATAGEAALALGQVDAAAAWLKRYCEDAAYQTFALNGTARQFREVWRFSIDDSPSGGVLAAFNAAALREPNSGISLGPGEARAIGAASETVRDAVPSMLDDALPMHHVRWLRRAVERAGAVVRLGADDSTGSGTGFVVLATDFLRERCPEEWRGLHLLITNAHVTTDDMATLTHPVLVGAGARPMPAKHLTAIFQAQQFLDGTAPQCHRVRQLWTSGFEEMDTTILVIEQWRPASNFVPVALASEPQLRAFETPVYVAGHPEGGDLTLSLHGGTFRRRVLQKGPGEQVGAGDRPDPGADVRLHYTSPTRPGSSGSPTFVGDDWQAVGIHRGTRRRVRDDDGRHYDAREAVWLQSIAHRVAATYPAQTVTL